MPRAAQALRELATVSRASTIYRSAAVGFAGPDFLNAVIAIDVLLSIEALSKHLTLLEDQSARDRSQPRFSSRTLDLDLLLYDDVVRKSESLPLPRDEILQQAFVLRPLAELAPDLVHPLTGLALGQHWRQMQQTIPSVSEQLSPVDLNLWD